MRLKGTDICVNYKYCILIHITLLLVNTGCVFLSAYYLSSFLDMLASFSYKKGIGIIINLAMMFTVQLICEYVKKKYWVAYREKKTNELECCIYRSYLESTVHLDNENQLSVACEKDLLEYVNFGVNKIPLVIQAFLGVIGIAGYLFCRQNGITVLLLLSLLSVCQFFPPYITKKYLVQNYIAAGQAEEVVRQEVAAGLSGILTIKMFHLQKWFMERYQKKQKICQTAGEHAAGISSIQSALYSGASLVQHTGFLATGLFAVSLGGVSIQTIIEGYILSAYFYQYIGRLAMIKADWAMYRAAEKRLLSLLQGSNNTTAYGFRDMDVKLPEEGLWLVKGENGAGKSTLFSIIGGTKHSNCEVVWKGIVLNEKERLKKTSWCPQMYLPFSATFEKLVTFIPRESLDLDYLQTCVRVFQINRENLRKPLSELSGGEQKKLILALVLAKRCDILLLDEPEVSLDKKGCETLIDILRREKRLVLLITHSAIFDDIANGIILIKGGGIDAR